MPAAARSCDPPRMTSVTKPAPLVGIFVGGAARRMGGRPKGMLAAPDGAPSLVERLVALARAQGFEVVLVGDHPAYARLGLEIVRDAVEGTGPLGGLVALLEHAGARPVVALACDLPFVDGPLLTRLAGESPEAVVLAPRREQRWEPLAARYLARVALPVAKQRLQARELSLWALCEALNARELTLDPAEAAKLADWDTPDDVVGQCELREG